MSEKKQYFYLKLKDDFFDSDELKLLQAMPDGYMYSDILLKLYLKSLQNAGRLIYKNIVPYTPEVLATLTNHQVGTIEKALDIFEKLGLIELLDNGVIYMLDIQNFIGKSSTEGDRKREYRNRIDNEKETIKKDKKIEMGQMSDKCPTNVHQSIEYRVQSIEEKGEKENHKVDFCLIVKMYNDTCVSLPQITRLSNSRKKMLSARMNQYNIDDFQILFKMAEESDFLKGQNKRKWKATFDWLIKDDNMTKVLEGNYKNPEKETNNNTKNKFHNFHQRTYDYDALEKQLLQAQTKQQEKSES